MTKRDIINITTNSAHIKLWYWKVSDNDILEKWKTKLGITDWDIDIEEIDTNQVAYPDDIGNDNYYIGVCKNHNKKTATIYHDVPLYEEAILHELLHIKHPTKSENWVNCETAKLLKL